MQSPQTAAPSASVPAALRITEIFYSIQGESVSAGVPTVFVRLTGCPLRCRYCDTEYAFSGGHLMEVPQVLERVAGYGALHVTVTGGEPLAQPSCLVLLKHLCDASYTVSLETGGALDIAPVDPRVSIVMDIKTPASGEEARNRYGNIAGLKAKDQVKFVICDRGDYDWAKQILLRHRLPERCCVLFSPSWEEQNASHLAEWILQDRLPVRLQLQLHKILWQGARGR